MAKTIGPKPVNARILIGPVVVRGRRPSANGAVAEWRLRSRGQPIWPEVVQAALSNTLDDVPIVALEQALSNDDIVSLYASGDAAILGEREFDLLKPGVFILNAARGGLIDETSLCRALDRGVIGGAWLDTFVVEPYAGPLTRYPQVILTPHIGSYTTECRRRMEMEAVENLLAAFGEAARIPGASYSRA